MHTHLIQEVHRVKQKHTLSRPRRRGPRHPHTHTCLRTHSRETSSNTGRQSGPEPLAFTPAASLLPASRPGLPRTLMKWAAVGSFCPHRKGSQEGGMGIRGGTLEASLFRFGVPLPPSFPGTVGQAAGLEERRGRQRVSRAYHQAGRPQGAKWRLSPLVTSSISHSRTGYIHFLLLL